MKENETDNTENNENPFEEEFDIDDVVNSGSVEEDEEEGKNKLLNDDDLREIIEMDDEARRAVAFVEKFGDSEEKWESSVIKKEDINNSDNIIAADLEELQKYSQKSKNTPKDESGSILGNEKENIEEVLNENEPSELTEYYKESKRKRKDFKDFLKFPKISGRERKFESKHHLPSELLKDRKKHVELIDDPQDTIEHEKTLIEITRDESGEMESIVVYCKCGEKTLIEFDYLNDGEDDSTEVVNNKFDEKPFVKESISDSEKSESKNTGSEDQGRDNG